MAQRAGPYEVIFKDNNIAINGKYVYPEEDTSFKSTPDSCIIEAHRVNTQIVSNFDAWYFQVGFDSAQQLVIDYLNNELIVDSVYIDSVLGLFVKYQCSEWPILIPLEPPNSKPAPSIKSEENPREIVAKTIEDGLSDSTHLLVLTNGVLAYLKNGQNILENISTIMHSSNGLDNSEKVDSIGKLIHNRKAARMIIDKWN